MEKLIFLFSLALILSACGKNSDILEAVLKKILILLISVLFSEYVCSSSEYVRIESENSALILKAVKGDPLYTIHFGDKSVSDEELSCQNYKGVLTYPAFGHGTIDDYALAVTHSDGDMTLDMVVDAVLVTKDAGSTVTRIRTKDKIYPFYATVCYRTFDGSNVIESWTELENREKKNVILRRFDSFQLPVRVGNVWCTTQYGEWANEARICEQPVPFGVFSVENRNGIRTAQSSRAEMMLSLDGKAREDEGRVIGLALCYSGNYQLRLITEMYNTVKDVPYHHFYAGIHPDDSAYPLAPKESFTTPAVAFAYSTEGMGEVSRNFHDWAREHRLIHGDKPRMTLLNSWEGVYFNVNEPKMEQMMKDINAIGGELFVMDDGWFGRGEFRRKDGSSGLGDWVVDTEKLPHGISWLTDKAEENGIKFGIWIEPEMANTRSELYRKHPEWIINAPKRDILCGRGNTQVVLDLGNPDVQDYVYSIVDKLLTENPSIAYIKWDSNMRLVSFGSSYLKADEQSKLVINYHKGLESVCKRIRANYPDIVIQCCASGGARVNYSMTPYFDEFWTSDNTDALQRIYIQWGTSLFYPSMVMAAHISASPNHQTDRIVPLKFRIDVAMSGRLGLELQPSDMSPEELELCRRAFSDYKSVRNTIQLGDQYRLVSPYEGKGAASMMYVSKDKSEAVFFEWKTEHLCYQTLPRIRFKGLDPDKEYEITELVKTEENRLPYEGKTFSGRYLMDSGLETIIFGIRRTSTGHEDGYSSCVLKISERN